VGPGSGIRFLTHDREVTHMADEEQLRILREGVDAWNRWRREHLGVLPDLRETDLSGADLGETYLGEANLIDANLREANLYGADLSGAELYEAELYEANLYEANLLSANLYRAKLCGANLYKANLREAILCGADLSKSDLSGATLVEADLEGSILTGCKVYGISVWSLNPENAQQNNLIITPLNEPVITVDNLEVAQFIYLLLSREKLRDIIDTVTSKTVLVLGRFTPERKAILEAMADKLRENNLIPIIFDFERATSRDFTETIKTLAGLSLFVIVDITNPRSTPLELQATVPDYQIPFVAIQQNGEEPFSMFRDLLNYDWVLNPVITYSSSDQLMRGFKIAIIDKAFEMHKKLLKRKAEKMETRSIAEYFNN